MRGKLIVILVGLLVICAGGGWMLVSGTKDAEQRRPDFFSSSKEFPTSGGQKMKPEW